MARSRDTTSWTLDRSAFRRAVTLPALSRMALFASSTASSLLLSSSTSVEGRSSHCLKIRLPVADPARESKASRDETWPPADPVPKASMTPRPTAVATSMARVCARENSLTQDRVRAAADVARAMRLDEGAFEAPR